MRQADPVHPAIRAAFETAVLPAGAAFFPARDADGVLPPGGIETPYDVPRIEVALWPLDAARTAISLAGHVARGEVLAALAHHTALPDPFGLPPAHRLEVRLTSIEHRISVWRHLAARGLRGLRWLVPPCGHDIWSYAVVQGPIADRDWPGIVERANAQRCTHLVSLNEAPPRTSPRGFDGTLEVLAQHAGDSDSRAPAWLESASVAFRAEGGALERQALNMLFGAGPDTVVVRGERPGFLRRCDPSWQDAASLDRAAGERCLASPGPYDEGRNILVVDPAARHLAFHAPLSRRSAGADDGATTRGGTSWLR